MILVIEPYGLKFGDEIEKVYMQRYSHTAHEDGICTEEEENELKATSETAPYKMFYAGMITSPGSGTYAIVYKDGEIGILQSYEVKKIGDEAINVRVLNSEYNRKGFLGANGVFYYDYVTDEMNLIDKNMNERNRKFCNNLIKFWTDKQVQIAKVGDELELVQLS